MQVKTGKQQEQTLAALGIPGAPAFLVYSEDPIADAVNGSWERAGEETWRVPRDADVQALLAWLYLGGWFLYGADAPVDQKELEAIGFAPDEKTMQETITRLGLRFLIVSFHDDTFWTVGSG